MTTLSFLLNPLTILAAGGVLLWTGSFIHRGRGKEEMKIGAGPSQEEAVLRELDRRLDEKENRLRALIDTAEAEAARLSRIIDDFNRIFCSDDGTRRVVASVFPDLEKDVRSELADLKEHFSDRGFSVNSQITNNTSVQRALDTNFETIPIANRAQTDRITVQPIGNVRTQDPIVSSLNKQELINNEEEINEDNFSEESLFEEIRAARSAGEEKRAPESIAGSCSAFAPKKSGLSNQSGTRSIENGCSRIEKSKKIRSLLKEKKKPDEIARELQLPISEVEVIVNVLNGQWKA